MEHNEHCSMGVEYFVENTNGKLHSVIGDCNCNQNTNCLTVWQVTNDNTYCESCGSKYEGKTDRETLEQLALETVSAENYYDMADTIDSLTDNELQAIIDCNGDYKKELAISGE